MSNYQTDMAEALADLLSATVARPSCQWSVIARCRCMSCASRRARSALAAYRSAQQAEAGAAGGFELPEPAGYLSCVSPEGVDYDKAVFTDDQVHAAFERGRQQGMEQAKIPFAGFDPKFCPGSNPDNPQEEPAASSAQEPEICGKVVDWEAEHRRLRHENNKLRKTNEKLRAAPAHLAGAAQGEREAFEAWCPHDSSTRSRDMAIAWEAWQARAAQPKGER